MSGLAPAQRPIAGGTLVIVEGDSDRAALETLARRMGRDLVADGVSIVAIGGAHAVARHLAGLRAEGFKGRLAGLCDAREEAYFRRASAQWVGVFVCHADLEDELIRALGAPAVETVIEALGDLRSFRSFQKQPAQQGRTLEQQLHRFMGTRSGRKAQYARALVEALDGERVPPPLDALLLAI